MSLDTVDEKLRRTLEELPAGAYTCDAEGLITYFNRCALELWGREPKLNDPADRFCGSFKLFTTDGAPIPHDECWMALALREGKAYNGCEIVIARPDGSRWIALAHANPFFDEQGRVVGAVNVLVDITDRRHGELARAKLAAIVDSSDDAIVSKDLNGIIQSWNAAAEHLFGYTADEAIGRHVSFLFPPDRLGEEDLIIKRLRAGERVQHFDTVRLRRDGTPVHVSLTISPIRDEMGRVVGASKIVRDITDRKASEEENYKLLLQLKEADHRKSEFLAMLGHELRNPLNPIRNAIKILRLKGPAEPELNMCRDVIDRQVDHLSRLVDDLLDISRIDRNKIELRKERAELATIVKGAVEACRQQIEESGHQLTIDLPPEPIYLDADVVRVSQVLVNLLNNAAKYTERGGRIWLSARREGSDAVVSVRDTGIGIAPEQMPHLFEMFYQEDGAKQRSQGGLGIGLALVQRLVEMHGGSVAAQSDGIGKGSEFIVRLPLTFEVPTHRSAASGNGQTRETAAHRILIVDDNRDAAATLALLLKLTGNQTQLAHDGLEAVEMAETFHPEVVLLDIGLPKLNGHDACRRIREQPWGKEMLMVALTGWGQDDDRRLSKEAGFDHHMVKPIDYQSLLGLLAELKTTV